MMVSPMTMQLRNAAEFEMRMLAKLALLEQLGVVRHVYADEWEILDAVKYNEAMQQGTKNA